MPKGYVVVSFDPHIPVLLHKRHTRMPPYPTSCCWHSKHVAECSTSAHAPPSYCPRQQVLHSPSGTLLRNHSSDNTQLPQHRGAVHVVRCQANQPAGASRLAVRGVVLQTPLSMHRHSSVGRSLRAPLPKPVYYNKSDIPHDVPAS